MSGGSTGGNTTSLGVNNDYESVDSIILIMVLIVFLIVVFASLFHYLIHKTEHHKFGQKVLEGLFHEVRSDWK